MIFAAMTEPTVSPGDLLTWLLCLASVVFFLDRAVSLWRGMQSRPPMDEQMHLLREELFFQFSTKCELKDALSLIEEKFQERNAHTEKWRNELRSDIHQVFDSLRALGREISHIEGRMAKSQQITIPGMSS